MEKDITTFLDELTKEIEEYPRKEHTKESIPKWALRGIVNRLIEEHL